MDTNSQPVIQRAPRGTYRRHSLEFKRRLVALTLEPDASVARIAREHGVNANQVFSWRKLFEAELPVPDGSTQEAALLPVMLAAPTTAQVPEQPNTGAMTLEIGRVRLRIDGQADPSTLAQILDRVLR
ncbi:IS66-like element accessory protein TnpA [Pseudoduganella sp. R-43]|uniref:IS66-like element accessory protein TnpA n=1 Tax=Pseudoduganella sp. R-43 TaxID=3404063 RepID=UPI003CF4F86D